MTIQYKNQGFKQAGTGKTTVFTCPTNATVIIKSVYCSNSDASSAILVNMNFVDSSDSNTEYEFFRDDRDWETLFTITVASLGHVKTVVLPVLACLKP